MGRNEVARPTGETAVIARLLADAAAGAGITQSELARRMHSNQSAVQRWLNGERSIPLGDFLRICDTLGLDPADVIRRARGND